MPTTTEQLSALIGHPQAERQLHVADTKLTTTSEIIKQGRDEGRSGDGYTTLG